MRSYLPLLALALMRCAAAAEKSRPGPGEHPDRPGDGGALDAAPSSVADAASVDAQSDARTRVDAQGEDARSAHDGRPHEAGAPYDGTADAGPWPMADEIMSAPVLSYVGTNGSDSACSRMFRAVGYAPKDELAHPLFLYFVGTQFVAEDESSQHDSEAAKRVLAAMAERGFVAYSVEYDNLFTSIFVDKTPCLYGAADSLLSRACALPSVDCSLGVSTWGHSQGALLAHSAANHDARVRAVWTTGYSGLQGAKLPFERLRVVNGEADTLNASYDTLNRAAGTTCVAGDSCLRPDGSGWILVRKAASLENSADHCWFDKRSCGDNTLNLEPSWTAPASTVLFALERNADWVAATVARP